MLFENRFDALLHPRGTSIDIEKDSESTLFLLDAQRM
jgi:hypothetical protein